MPNPHISAILNNCSLHLLTPSLKNEIKKLADTGGINAFQESYELLKNCFAEFYGIEKKKFNWRDFSDLLQRYNAFDCQIIMGPVLRMVLGHYLRRPEMKDQLDLMKIVDPEAAGLTLEQFIKSKSDLKNSGRYSSLSPDELFIFVAKPFGFNLPYHKDGRTQQQMIPNTVALSTIPIYHEGGVEGAEAGGHWELEKNANDRVYVEREDTTQLSAYIPLLGDDRYVTIEGLKLLQDHVILTYQSLVDGSQLNNGFATLDLTLAQIGKFTFNVNYVDKERSKQLLGAGITETTARFITHYTEPTFGYDLNFIKLIDANRGDNILYTPAKSAVEIALAYTPLEYKLALTLLAPVVVPLRPSLIDVAAISSKIRDSKVRNLRADEVSRLKHVEHILFNEGLSDALYSVCNKSEIIPLLTVEFITLLIADEHFLEKANAELQEKAKKISKISLDNFNDDLSRIQNSSNLVTESPLLLTDHSSSSTSPSDSSVKLPESSNIKDLVSLMQTLKSQLSTHVWMGLTQEVKLTAFDNLIKKCAQPDANLTQIFNELVHVATIHRTRFGVFFHMSRKNSSTTHTAKALSLELVKDKYKELRASLGYEGKTAQDIRADFDKKVSNQDYYGSNTI